MNIYDDVKFDNLINRTYQKSYGGYQCLGPCYSPGTWIVHPITLDYITHKNQYFCPTEDHLVKDDKTGKEYKMVIDMCKKTDDVDINLMQFNILSPRIDFDCEQFLKIYYKIYSFENAINWIKKNSASYFTILRVLECSWKIYGNNLNILSDRLVEIYIDIIKKKWINVIYKEIKNYITIKDNKIYFSNKDNNNNNNKIEKINFILDKLVNKNNIYKILEMHIIKNNKNWGKITNHGHKILDEIIKYFINKINDSIY